jgi:NADH:ubiquinone oxidoreductase subunit E
LTYSEVDGVDGSAGRFNVRVRKKPRYVDVDKCTGCGQCVENCLVENVAYLEMPAAPKLDIDDEKSALVERVVGRYDGGPETLVPILQDISAELNWLPPEVLTRVAERKQLTLEHVLHIATFYRSFSLKPRGKHIVSVCTGTACHVQGAPRIVSRLERDLGIGVGETTPDMQFTLETVRCLGCCGLAPVVTVGEELHGKVKPGEAAKLIEKSAV